MIVDASAQVMANRTLSSDYNVLTLDAPAVARAARPGQFVMVKAEAHDEPLLRRPFSIFEIVRGADGAPSGLTLFSKRIGPATRLLYAARPGDRIACLGPLGRPWPLVDPPHHAYLVAGGVGLAAFATLADDLVSRGVPTTLFYGGRTRGDLFYVDDFRGKGVEVVLTTEDGSAGERGRVTVALERRLSSRGSARPLVYACGPEPMMAAAVMLARRFECPSQVSLERIMGCGMGGCYSCVVPIRHGSDGFHHVRSCIAGPVMDGEQVLWDETRHRPGH